MITLATLRALQLPSGAALLADLAAADLSDAHTLKLLTDLRKHHPADVAAAALETARLRVKGREKFGARADTMFFTRDSLEQATDSRISRYRFGAAWLPNDVFAADLGCGIGGDSLALAERGPLIGVDLDPLRLAMAHANVGQESAQFVQADVRAPLPFSAQIGYMFFDPARRIEGRRIHSVNEYIPPLATIKRWSADVRCDVKLSPGVDLHELGAYPNSAIEFISLTGDLKEAVLRLNTPRDSERIATLIDAAGDYVQLSRHLQPEPLVDISAPRRILYEPDPAVIRAGLVKDLAAQIGAFLIDPTIAYLTADTFTPTPFARTWQIEAWLPFNLKKLRAYLVGRGVGRVTVKKRGSPLTPEELIAKLHLPGGGLERIVVLTRVQGAPAVIICTPGGD